MIQQKAYAKLDLGIEIYPEKLGDGYFPVRYIDCKLDLCDDLFFENQKGTIEVVCSEPLLLQEDNFVYKAAILLRELAGSRNLGAKITLKKNIPIKAGFGGGSSDAAAAVWGLSKIWKIKVSENMIATMANQLGKDFYYSWHGKLSEVVGKGRIYQVLSIDANLPEFWLLVIVPSEEKPSTAWVYENLKLSKNRQDSGKIEKLKMAILAGKKENILKNLANDFEQPVSVHFPVVGKMKNDLEKVGALKGIMAGAGLAVVGFFESRKKAEEGKALLNGKYRKIYISRPIN